MAKTASKSATKSKTATKKAATKKPAAKKAAAKAAPKASTKTLSRSKNPTDVVKIKKVSRAVTRLVEPGSQVDCQHCDERVKFQAKMRHQQVICNVYEKSQWIRVVHYHSDCYKLAKNPFGKPLD